MMSIFSPRSSETTMRTREPRGPTQAPTGIDAVGVRDDRDLRAVAGLAGDVGDLHQAVGDLRHLELEQLLDQLRVAAETMMLGPRVEEETSLMTALMRCEWS
jgi:hypothetical protein